MKQWFTAGDLAELKLPEMATTRQGVQYSATNFNWVKRNRSEQGGGVEYHFNSFPQASQAALLERFFAERSIDSTIMQQISTDRASRRRDARLIILQSLAAFRRETKLPDAKAIIAYAMTYNAHLVTEIPEWVYEIIPDVSERTLWRWSQKRREQRFEDLSRSQNNRKGTGALDRAESGELSKYIVTLICAQPHLNAAQVRDLCRDKFTDTIHVRHEKTGKEVTVEHARNSLGAEIAKKWQKSSSYLSFLCHSNCPAFYKMQFYLSFLFLLKMPFKSVFNTLLNG